MNRLLAAFATLAALTACSENSISKIDDNQGNTGPMIEVEPQFIQYGQLAAGEQEVNVFTINSVGGEDLEISSIEMESTSAASFTILTSGFEEVMLPGTRQDIEVAFSPLGATNQTGRVIIASNDPDSRRTTVDLEGAGLVPELQIDPDPYDFGNTYVGCPRDGVITLRNVGSDLLVISEIAGMGEGFSYSNPNVLPAELAAGASINVNLQFDPDYEQSYEGTLTVVSNEPLGVREGVQMGSGLYAAAYSDDFDVPTNPPSDIMFLVDQSCSMDANQTALANNFSYFISELSNYTTNWHVMVVNDDDGCNNSGILTSSTASYGDRFRTAVSAGGGSYTESLLTPAARASGLTNSGQCNAGFMRSSAILHIIMVSDEPEQSPERWDVLTSRIIANKGSASLVKLSAIVGNVPSGCSGNGDADAGTGYYEAVNYTGGEFLSICASSWQSYMPLLAEASVNQSSFELSATPVEYTIEVFVNGAQVTSGWHYDAATNSVMFDSNVPEGGDHVRVDYAGAANCD